MKAVVIENEFDIPGELKGFIKDNATLFEGEVKVLSHARHRPEIVKNAFKDGFDAVIVSSTFMYKDQLEDSVKLFASSGVRINFFIIAATDKLNDFIGTFLGRPDKSSDFQDYDGFIKIIKQWVADGLVFEIVKDHSATERIFDEFHGHSYTSNPVDRLPYKAEKVLYSSIYDMFYLENENEHRCADFIKWVHRK